jgi:hypothetical protein
MLSHTSGLNSKSSYGIFIERYSNAIIFTVVDARPRATLNKNGNRLLPIKLQVGLCMHGYRASSSYFNTDDTVTRYLDLPSNEWG